MRKYSQTQPGYVQIYDDKDLYAGVICVNLQQFIVGIRYFPVFTYYGRYTGQYINLTKSEVARLKKFRFIGNQWVDG